MGLNAPVRAPAPIDGETSMPPLTLSKFRTPVAALALGGMLVAPVAAAEMEWSFETIGRGIKPALALDASGTPHVTFLTEEMRGAVFYATNQSGAWTTATVAEGYFYGPVDIDVTPDGVPTIVYHDHEDRRFRPELGSGVVAIGKSDGWELVRLNDRGHDQWDADVAVEDNGIWHMAGIDPSQFGSQDGLEYATNAFGPPRVEQVGPGPLPYEFGVSIEVGTGGTVGITYFDASGADLRLALRSPGEDGTWTITTVESEGDVGRYSSLAFAADGTPHISYFAATGRGGGIVRYATQLPGGNWQIEDIGTLSNVAAGMTGARKITALALDAQGNPHVMFSDRDTVVQASREEGVWVATAIVKGRGRLGQLVEFALDSQGRPHVTFFEVTGSSPLMGDIIYATATGGES
jgi:hypothetical protein